jgi:glycosyltransferase involved in cell wall biosynthesis
MVNAKISVIIPILNGEKSIRSCLTSVLSQDVAIHECIIVDNNSNDRTAEIIKEFQKDHSNVVYVFEPTVGRGAARNAGIAKATGDIIAMTDVDCVVSKDWLRNITAPIVRGTEAIVVGGQYAIGGNYWSRNTQKMYDYTLKLGGARNGYSNFTDTKNFAIVCQLLKETLFDERFKVLENVEIEFRLRPKARYRYLDEVKVGHIHAETMWAVMKMGYERAYWFAQIYHKFKGVPYPNGELIFIPMPHFKFYSSLLKINVRAIKEQGIGHIFFFLAFDLAWKLGSAVGFAKPNKAFYSKESENTL